MVHSESAMAAKAAQRYLHGIVTNGRGVSDASLSYFANSFLTEMGRIAPEVDRFSRGTASAVARVSHGYRVVFRSSEADNCLEFRAAEKLLFANRSFVDGGIKRALTSQLFAERVVSSNGNKVRAAIAAFVKPAVHMLVTHEIFHTAQGLRTIDVVREAARTVGWPEVAKYDVDADFRAATVEATINAFRDGDTTLAGILTHFEDALSYQIQFNAPVFGSPASKPHKRARLAGKVVQLARVVVANRTGRRIDETTFRALTMPLYAAPNETHTRIGITSVDPLMFIGSCEGRDNDDIRNFFNL